MGPGSGPGPGAGPGSARAHPTPAAQALPKPLGRPWDTPGTPWDTLGRPWDLLGRPWDALGTPLGRWDASGTPLGPSWDAFGLKFVESRPKFIETADLGSTWGRFLVDVSRCELLRVALKLRVCCVR